MEDAQSEAEPEDAVPEEWQDRVPELFLASRNPRSPAPLLPLARTALAYTAAGAWPFAWVWIEFLRLDAANAASNMCDVYGCAPESHVFVEQNMMWAVLLSGASVAVTAGLIRLRRFVRARRRVTPPNEAPVSRYAVAGVFVAVCTLAFLVGALRGVIIDHLGR
jgi:uncharacterized membrane protein YidH (DUF202 family)